MNNDIKSISECLKIDKAESVKNRQFCYTFLTLLNYVFLNFFSKSTILCM